jgi:hypothetical protein
MSDDNGAIQFVQYLRPNGARREVSITRPSLVVAQAQKLVEAGCRLEIEELTTGQVSMTVERDDDEGETQVLGMEVVPNGPRVPPAVDKMIADAVAALSAGHE